MLLSVIIPAYKEAENLKSILPRIKQTCAGLGVEYEILIIDTLNKMDNTSDICRENGVVYFNREKTNNYGDAVRTGIKYAKGEAILFMDADGSHDPEFIEKLYKEKVQSNCDVVIASRYVNGGDSENSFALKAISILLNTFYAVILNLSCRDVSNSFKIYDATQLKRLNLKCDNFDIIEEILYLMKVNKKDLKIKELPFHFKKRAFGESKREFLSFMISYLKTLFRLRFRKK